LNADAGRVQLWC